LAAKIRKIRLSKSRKRLFSVKREKFIQLANEKQMKTTIFFAFLSGRAVGAAKGTK